MQMMGVAQFQPEKGNQQASYAKLCALLTEAKNHEVDYLFLPETALTGYFLEHGVFDLALTQIEIRDILYRAYQEVDYAKALVLSIGFYEQTHEALFNSAITVLLQVETIPQTLHIHRKIFLPTYDVFDEARYVQPGQVLEASGTTPSLGTLVCEDAWHSITATTLALQGADILYIPLASPARGISGHEPRNVDQWREIAKGFAREHGVYVVLSGLVGFEGGNGFAGPSLIVDPNGEVLAELPLWQEGLLTAPFHPEMIFRARTESPLLHNLRDKLLILQRGLANADTPR